MSVKNCIGDFYSLEERPSYLWLWQMTSMILGKEHNFIVVLWFDFFFVLCSTSSPDAAIEPWLKQLWDKLLSLYPIPVGQSLISDSVLYPTKLNICSTMLYLSDP